MSIFRREVEPPPAKTTPPPSPSARRPSPRDMAPQSQDSAHIANGTKVVGEVTGTTRLVIDGFVEGSVRLENEVVIGSQGKVEGTVVAESVQVGGRVHGNIRGIKKVEVLSSGGLEGDVISPRVVIADGAFLKGKVEMTDNVGTVKGGAPSGTSAKPTSKSAGPAPRTPSAHGSKDKTGDAPRAGVAGREGSVPTGDSEGPKTGRQQGQHGGRKGRGGR